MRTLAAINLRSRSPRSRPGASLGTRSSGRSLRCSMGHLRLGRLALSPSRFAAQQFSLLSRFACARDVRASLIALSMRFGTSSGPSVLMLLRSPLPSRAVSGRGALDGRIEDRLILVTSPRRPADQPARRRRGGRSERSVSSQRTRAPLYRSPGSTRPLPGGHVSRRARWPWSRPVRIARAHDGSSAHFWVRLLRAYHEDQGLQRRTSGTPVDTTPWRITAPTPVRSHPWRHGLSRRWLREERSSSRSWCRRQMRAADRRLERRQ